MTYSSSPKKRSEPPARVADYAQQDAVEFEEDGVGILPRTLLMDEDVAGDAPAAPRRKHDEQEGGSSSSSSSVVARKKDTQKEDISVVDRGTASPARTPGEITATVVPTEGSHLAEGAGTTTEGETADRPDPPPPPPDASAPETPPPASPGPGAPTEDAPSPPAETSRPPSANANTGRPAAAEQAAPPASADPGPPTTQQGQLPAAPDAPAAPPDDAAPADVDIPDDEETNAAATKLQAIQRGKQARAEVEERRQERERSEPLSDEQLFDLAVGDDRADSSGGAGGAEGAPDHPRKDQKPDSPRGRKHEEAEEQAAAEKISKHSKHVVPDTINQPVKKTAKRASPRPPNPEFTFTEPASKEAFNFFKSAEDRFPELQPEAPIEACLETAWRSTSRTAVSPPPSPPRSASVSPKHKSGASSPASASRLDASFAAAPSTLSGGDSMTTSTKRIGGRLTIEDSVAGQIPDRRTYAGTFRDGKFEPSRAMSVEFEQGTKADSAQHHLFYYTRT